MCMNAMMQTSKIIDENAPKLLINYDVAEMVTDAMNVLKCYGKLTDSVSISGKNIHGIMYQDTVLTIVSDRSKLNVCVYRNRTETMVIGIADGMVNSYHWELLFIDKHMKALLSEYDKLHTNASGKSNDD